MLLWGNRIAFCATIFGISLISIVDAKLKVCATTSIVADLVKNIGGGYIEIVALMGPGVDPHLYKATASDINKIKDSDILFYNGLHLEGRMTEVFEQLAKKGKRTCAIAEEVNEAYLFKLGGNEKATYDPHIWFDPEIWSMCADVVASRLIEIDPENASRYRRFLSKYKKKLYQLYKWGQREAGHLADAQRVLVTSHDAYNYFGRAFGFQVVAIQGISTVSEAGLADIISTVKFVQEKQIKAIFVESSVSPAAIARVSKDSGAKIAGELFSDALGFGDKYVGHIKYDVGTYIGAFKYNMQTIVESLR